MLHDPKDVKLFPKLSAEDIEVLQRYGEIVAFQDNDIVLKEGEIGAPVFIVLEGHLRVFRRVGTAEELLAFHGKFGFSGDLNVLTRSPSIFHLQACGATRLLRLDAASIRKLIADNSPLATTLLEALANRVRQTDSHLVQEEKLAALGKMAAGLAHELNNPATAARRAAKLMTENLRATPLRILAHDTTYTESDKVHLREFFARRFDNTQTARLDPLERSDLEQDLACWLEDHHISVAEEMAPIFADGGIRVEDLENWREKLGPHFMKGIFWMEATIRLTALASDVESSTDRIAELVSALKQYSYMDQAKYQEVDVRSSIEITLKIMHHKLKSGVVVKREFAQDLPKICAYAGELNQVWTNLIDNAIDAMDGHGVLTIRTRQVDKSIVVEISDNGKGIAPEIQNRIFEPFFTTKTQGNGTGLGLDITYRIVVYRHGGHIRLRTQPGCGTTFEVELPIQPPKEADIIAALEVPETVPTK